MSKLKTEVKFVEVSGRTLSQRTSYYEDGTVAVKGTYGASQNGWEWNVPVGIVEKFYENGQLEHKLIYNTNGNLDGECVFYNKKGEMVRKRLYAKDVLIEEHNYVDEAALEK